MDVCNECGFTLTPDGDDEPFCMRCEREDAQNENRRLYPVESLAYQMARHIRNTDKVPATTWGVQAIDLLDRLRALDPEKYDNLVKH